MERQFTGDEKPLEETLTNSTSSDEFANLTLFQSLKKWKLVALYCLAMSSAILMYGFDYVIIGTVSAMPSFQHKFGQLYEGDWILPGMWLAVWTCASPICSMPGAIFGGWFADRYGRRASLFLGSLLSAIGVAICFASDLPDAINSRRGMFLAGKGFQGSAIGMVLSTVQTYMSEILPPSLRGPLMAFYPTFTLLGQLIGAVVIYACLDVDAGYRICFATQWPFSAVPMLVAVLSPESPVYLIRQNQYQKAFQAQTKLDAKTIPTAQVLETIRKNIEREKLQTRATYVDCFNTANRRRTMIIVLANSLPQLFGLALLAKASYFGQVVGMEPDVSLITLVLGLVAGFLANIASIWILSRVGRRRLILVSMGILTVLWTGLGIAGIWDSTVTVWYTCGTLIAVVVTAGLGVWPASYAVSAETSALHLRAKSQGIAWFTVGFTSSVFGFVVPLMFNPDEGDLGAKVGFVYSGCCAIGFALSFFFVPEMKGRTSAEIDKMFDEKLAVRQFRHWKLSARSESV